MERPYTKYEVTELNTRVKTFKSAPKDIFEGDDYKTHSFDTVEEAIACQEQLESQGIWTNRTTSIYC